MEATSPANAGGKTYVLKSAPRSGPTPLGHYWQLWRAIEQRQPGLDRIRLTQRVLGRVPRVTAMRPEELAKMVHVFARILERTVCGGTRSDTETTREALMQRAGESPATFPPSEPESKSASANSPSTLGHSAADFAFGPRSLTDRKLEEAGKGANTQPSTFNLQPSTFDAPASLQAVDGLASSAGVATRSKDDAPFTAGPAAAMSTPATPERALGFPPEDQTALSDGSAGEDAPQHVSRARAERLLPANTKRSARWRRLYDADAKLTAEFPELTYAVRARLLDCSIKMLWAVHHVYAPRGFASGRTNCGGKPDYTPTPEELACVREIAVRLDESLARGRGRGTSRIAAYRLAAKSGDPRISGQFQAVINRDRTGKRVPPSWMRLLDLPTNVLDAHRDARSTQATYVCTPRHRTIITEEGLEVPMQCGSIFETDDGTLNFYAHIPWPFGGDKCSERFGVKLARWQFLPVVDVHSEMCLSFDIVCREKGSYRGEDSRAIIGRTMFEVDTPALWRLERGAWESKIVRDALELSSVPVFNAWHSKQKSAIERFFDRMWTPASLIPGHVGRDRDRFKQITNLALACQKGSHDPRDYFLDLSDATPRVIKCVQFCNTEPIVSRSGWGKWVPQERWVSQRAGNAQRLHESMRVWFSREQKVWAVRKCCVGGSVDGPQVKFPVYFQCPELWEFEGCHVRVFFDPYADPNLGTIILEDEAWRKYRRGHVIARDVPALDLPPQAVLAEDWDDPERARQLAVRKAIGKAVRVEMWNWLGGRGTRAEDGLGNTAVRQMPVEQSEIRRGFSAFGSRIVPPTPADRSARRARNRADAELLNAL